MTIFRSNIIDVERLKYQFVTSNDPDLIGVEVLLDGNVLMDMSMDADGRTSVLWDADGGMVEFDLGQLRSVLDYCEKELKAWHANLAEPGAIWGER